MPAPLTLSTPMCPRDRQDPLTTTLVNHSLRPLPREKPLMSSGQPATERHPQRLSQREASSAIYSYGGYILY